MCNSKSCKHKSIPVAIYIYHLTSFDPYHCKIMILERVILSLNLVCTIQESVHEMHGNMEPATPPRIYTCEAGTNLHESCVERFQSSVVFQNTQTNNNPNQHSTISWPVRVPKSWCWYPSQLLKPGEDSRCSGIFMVSARVPRYLRGASKQGKLPD